MCAVLQVRILPASPAYPADTQEVTASAGCPPAPRRPTLKSGHVRVENRPDAARFTTPPDRRARQALPEVRTARQLPLQRPGRGGLRAMHELASASACSRPRARDRRGSPPRGPAGAIESRPQDRAVACRRRGRCGAAPQLPLDVTPPPTADTAWGSQVRILPGSPALLPTTQAATAFCPRARRNANGADSGA